MIEDLITLFDWSETWQLPFNQSKCKVMHFGRNNPEATYEIGDTVIEEVTEEKDLGVVFDPHLTFTRQHDKAIAKANSRIGLIKRSFKHLDAKSFVLLYKTLVRPIVEYCSVVTHPVRKQDQDRLEKVQRRATRLVPGMKGMSYTERLKELNLQSLKYRRKRSDVLQCYRILSQIDQVDESHFFTLRQDERTRSNGRKIYKSQCRTKTRSNVFSQRVVDRWNALPSDTVSASTINCFKSRLGKAWTHDPDKLLSDSPS